MDAMFFIFPILFGLVFVVVIVGMVIHMILFGTLFGVVVKRIADAAEQQRELQAAQEPRLCTYCGVTIPAGGEQCPGCGAKR